MGSMVYCWGFHLPWVYVHSAICETYGVWWCSMDLLSLRRSIWHADMWILLYVKLSGCNGVSWIFDLLVGGLSAMGICISWLYVKLTGCKSVAWIYAWLEDLSAMGICAFFYICNWLGVMVLHRSMLIWGGPSTKGICEFCHMWNL